jgi:outer membrane protein OmpA-like peptidoglycan-associated protein
MSHSKEIIAATLAVVLLAATSAYAIENPDTTLNIDHRLGISNPDTPSEINQRIGVGDPVAGKDKSAFCQGCHGEDGNSLTGAFPKLAGQWSDYIQKQFREFQNGARVNETMTDMAAGVGEFQDVFDIAAYFASQKQMVGSPIEGEAEKELFLEGEKLYTQGNRETGSFRCIKCHGIHGSGEPLNNNLFPVLGGQHKAYLIKQLTEFKHEVRENDRSGMMLRITTHLTAHQIEALATYLSRVPPAPEPAPVAVTTPPPAPVPESWKTLLEDKPVRIEGSSFVAGSSNLKPGVHGELENVVGFAAKYPDAMLELIGYSDSTGSAKTNQKLSLARAESVRKYLVKKGVASSRISTKGEGPANPVADNKTKEGREKNRRVEINSVIKEEKKVRVSG